MTAKSVATVFQHVVLLSFFLALGCFAADPLHNVPADPLHIRLQYTYTAAGADHGDSVDCSAPGTMRVASNSSAEFCCRMPTKEEEAGQEGEEPKSFAAILRSLHTRSKTDSSCISYVDGWWTYRICLGRDIRQFHVDDGRHIDETLPDVIVLGRFDTDVDATNYDALTERYIEGTPCQVGSSKPRSTTVSYVCSDQHSLPHVLSIFEVASCEYTIAVGSAMFCKSQVKTSLQCTTPGLLWSKTKPGQLPWTFRDATLNWQIMSSAVDPTAPSVPFPAECAIAVGVPLAGKRVAVADASTPSTANSHAECATRCSEDASCHVFTFHAAGKCMLHGWANPSAADLSVFGAHSGKLGGYCGDGPALRAAHSWPATHT